MPASTPFFAEFGPLLFGRPPRSLRDQLSAKLLLQADSISGLREAFGPMIPDALLCLQTTQEIRVKSQLLILLKNPRFAENRYV